MSWQYSPLSIPLFIATGISVVIAYMAWQRRESPGATTLLYLMAAIALWTLTSGMENLVYKIPDKIFWSKIQYLGIASTPLLYMIFSFRFSQRDHWLSRATFFLLWLIPITTITLAATNDWHGLIWRGFSRNPDNPALLIYHYGPWFWLNLIFGYLSMAVGLMVFIWLIPQVDRLQRRQIFGMIFSGVIPWVGNIIYLLGLIPIPGFDITPFSFSISGLVLGLSLFSFRLFDLAPIARSRLVDTMQDAVIVIDRHGYIADINPAALFLVGTTYENVIGKPAQDGLSHWPRLAHNFKGNFDSPTIQRVVQDIKNRWYDCRLSPLRDDNKQITGWLVVLRDITQQRQAETEIKQLATVVEQAHATIVITDQQGKITYANPYFETVTGYTIEEAIGAKPNLLKSGYQDKSFYEELWSTISEGETWEGNFINRRKDGSLYHEAATIFPIKTRDGETTNFAAVKRDITQQVNAEEEIQRFSQQLETLHEISISLSLAQTRDEICRLAVELGYQDLGFDRLGLWVIDPTDADYLRGSYTIDEQGNLCVEREQFLSIQIDQMYGLLNYGKSRVFYHKHHEIRNALGETVGFGEVASTGLWDGNTMMGYLATDNLLSGKEIPKRQVDILSLFGQILGNLLVREKTEKEIKAHARQQELLNDITQAAIQVIAFEDMLQVLADRMGELLEADGCYITLWDEEKKSVIPAAAYGPLREEYQSIANPQSGEPTLTENVLASGEVLIIEDVKNTHHLSKRLADKFPTRSCITLPLIANRQKLGAALIAFNAQRSFTQAEIDLSRQAAQQIALAVLKAKLLDEARDRVRESETLRKASAAIVATLNQEEAINRILEELNWVVPYDSASVLRMHGEQMEILGGRGFSDSDQVIGISFPLIGTPNAVVVEQGTFYIIEDAPKQFSAFKKPPHDHIRGWMGIPLFVKEKMIGMLALDSHQPGSFTGDHARLASAFADQVAIALENSRLFEETQRLAIRDSLTSLYNRRYFMELASKQFEHARRYQHPLSIIMLDIDHFKKVNDTFGHMAGDLVLQTAAKLCQTSLRSSDLIGRYGGEEFVITLPETPIQKPIEDKKGQKSDSPSNEAGISVAERLRKRIEQELFQLEKADISLTISLGIAEMDDHCPTVEKLIDQADLALLEAKQRGRNQIIAWPFKEPTDQTQ